MTWVLISNINFEVVPLGLFLCGANVSHKNDSPNLTQKSLVVYLKAGGRSVNLIFIVVSIHGRPQASIAAVFRQSAGYVLN